MKSTSRRISTLVFSVLMVGAYSSSFAYVAKWNDKRFGDAENQSVFKVDGVMWPQYEFLDKGSSTGSGRGFLDGSNDSQGFAIGRTYINVRGKVKSGKYKGWGFRITPDMVREKSQPSTSTYKSANKYMFMLKGAYVTIPVTKKINVWFGQMGAPNHVGGAGHSPQKVQGHRYFDDDGRQPTSDSGYFGTYLKGVKLNINLGWMGISTMVANGEGFKKYNGASNNPTNLSKLTNASGGYGYDWVSYIHFRPIGQKKKSKFRVTIGFPIRLANYFGGRPEEFEGMKANLAGNTLDAVYYKGNADTSKDRVIGAEVAIESKSKGFSWTLIVGTMSKRDRRGSAYMIDKNLAETGNYNMSNANTYYQFSPDAKGNSKYAVFHAKMGKFGLFYYKSIGTGKGNATEKRKLGTVVQREYLAAYMDAAYQSGAATVQAAFDSVDPYAINLGQNKQTRTVYGITYHFHKRFKATLGLTRTVNTDSKGAPQQISNLNNIQDTGTSTFGSDVTNSLGAINNSTKGVKVENIAGQLAEYKQLWIRTQYKY